MIYPGMARIVTRVAPVPPGVDSDPSARRSSPSSATQQQRLQNASSSRMNAEARSPHTNPLRPALSPSQLQAVLSPNAPTRRKLVPSRPDYAGAPAGLLANPTFASQLTGSSRSTAPKMFRAHASPRAPQEPCSQLSSARAQGQFSAGQASQELPGQQQPRGPYALQVQVNELGVVAENFRPSEFNVLRVVAEAFVFVGLVLLRWTASFSSPQRVTALVKLGLVALFFTLHPIYASVAAGVVVVTYLYEKVYASRGKTG